MISFNLNELENIEYALNLLHTRLCSQIEYMELDASTSKAALLSAKIKNKELQELLTKVREETGSGAV